jgi:hypothetical protein
MIATSTMMHRQTFAVLLVTMLLTSLIACKKENEHYAENRAPAAYSSDVVDKWMTMQLRLMQNASGIPNHPFARHFAYSGIAALEAISPGLPFNNRYSKKWQGLTGLPKADETTPYFYPANVNAALAFINRSFFPNASTTDRAAIDSLENALQVEFLRTQPEAIVSTSAQFGKAVASAIFNWAENDGYKNAGNAYTAPSGEGLWVPTPPLFASAITPYWGQNRTIVDGSTTGTQPPPPAAYSTDPKSAFYQMAKQVYDTSQTLTDEQRAMVNFWRDVPGVSTPGHWLSITQQTIRQRNARLDKAVLAYALTGVALHDAIIGCFQAKYRYNLVRPVTYIRTEMGTASWSPLIPTPAHPEYPSAHAVFSAAAAEILQWLFGNSGKFTDHTYDAWGYAPRSFLSFREMADEAGRSRFYAGIHYLPSIEAGLLEGKRVAANVLTAASPAK